jgi:hypothetical protein
MKLCCKMMFLGASTDVGIKPNIMIILTVTRQVAPVLRLSYSGTRWVFDAEQHFVEGTMGIRTLYLRYIAIRPVLVFPVLQQSVTGTTDGGHLQRQTTH